LLLLDRDFSAQSTLLIGIFAVVFAAAVVIDLAALLQFAGLVGGLPLHILEIAGSLTALTILPLLVMGLSISSDLNRKG
jgi:hypothetical protein